MPWPTPAGPTLKHNSEPQKKNREREENTNTAHHRLPISAPITMGVKQTRKFYLELTVYQQIFKQKQTTVHRNLVRKFKVQNGKK